MPEAERFDIRTVPLDAAWETFVDSAAGSHTFARSDWLRCVHRVWPEDLIVRGAYLKDPLVAAVVGLQTTRPLLRRLATPPLLPHAGFLFRKPVSEQLPRQEAERNSTWQALLADLSDYHHLYLSCGSGITDVREPVWAGWQAHPRYTYQIDLPADRQQVWDGFERRMRTVIRKAEGTGFHVEPTTDHSTFSDLYRKTYPDTPPPVETVQTQRFIEAGLEAGLIEGHSVLSPTGDVAATVYFALDDKAETPQLSAWVAGADPAFRDAGASALLYWKVLETTTAARFDFVGANMASIALFKRGFGGRLVSYYALEKWNSGWRRLAAALRG
ncbi:MAG: GNAT family N-acetyltransferase [Gemmatimonadetes bacterium]|nr:GNAT family N-acetyltransferase [Gemmatimonadota bacterium]